MMRVVRLGLRMKCVRIWMDATNIIGWQSNVAMRSEGLPQAHDVSRFLLYVIAPHFVSRVISCIDPLGVYCSSCT